MNLLRHEQVQCELAETRASDVTHTQAIRPRIPKVLISHAIKETSKSSRFKFILPVV